MNVIKVFTWSVRIATNTTDVAKLQHVHQDHGIIKRQVLKKTTWTSLPSDSVTSQDVQCGCVAVQRL